MEIALIIGAVIVVYILWNLLGNWIAQKFWPTMKSADEGDRVIYSIVFRFIMFFLAMTGVGVAAALGYIEL